MASAAGRVDLDGKQIKQMTICMIGVGGFIGSHLCEKLMAETPHKILALDVYNDKIKHLLEPSDGNPWSDRIQFHHLNIKYDSRLEGLIKTSDLTINLLAICTPADYNMHFLDIIYSNFIGGYGDGEGIRDGGMRGGVDDFNVVIVNDVV